MNIDNHSSTTDSSNSPTQNNHILIDIENNHIELENNIDIQEESNLIQYTNNHFNNVTNNDLFKLRSDYAQTNIDCTNFIQSKFIRCDSPMTISNYGSRAGSSSNSDIDDNTPPLTLNKQISLEDIAVFKNSIQSPKTKHKNHLRKRNSKFKQLAYHDVEKTLDKYYDMELDSKFSSELDILTTFMKGQKNIYIQCKLLSQWRLNSLMIPSLLITFSVTILSPLITCNSMHNWIISGLNAATALLISIMNYFKLESSTQMFLQLANHYDKLETSLELANSKLLLMETDTEKRTIVLNEIKLIEQKMNEMKEVNNVLIPAEIKTLFPIICHVNIFSFIKKLENHKQILIFKFKDIKNEIRYIIHKWSKEENENFEDLSFNIIQHKNYEKLREQKRLNYLYDIKEKLKAELNDYKSAYSSMDDIFIREIKHAENITTRLGIWFICLWRFNNKHIKLDNINPILDKYFHFLFVNDAD